LLGSGDKEMDRKGKKIVIIGGGIAGLCTAVYARKCGYQAEVLEMHDMAGGLAMSWRRGPYTFETCLHWLYGSRPGGSMHARWREVFDIEKLDFINPQELVCIEDAGGERLHIWTDPHRLEQEFLKHAPQDAVPIRRYISEILRLSKFKMPDPSEGWLKLAWTLFEDAACIPLLRKLTSTTSADYGKGFTNPLVKSYFGSGEMGRLSALALVFSLAAMYDANAGYCSGGSQAIIRLIEEKLTALGGKVRFGARVKRVLVENGAATGVELSNGETIAADWVISAADGHATIYEMLGGQYTGPGIDRIYTDLETFSSYVQVSLGVGLDLSAQPAHLTLLLDTPFEVDPGAEAGQVAFRFFHFDPSFAPPGKTAVTCFLPTRNAAHWTGLRENNLAAYRAQKDRIAQSVIGILDARIPGFRHAVEVVDVATPASIIRYTGNWKGSMEGWLLAPATGVKQLPATLPGLRQFRMVGQWVSPGGGLPSGLMTARAGIRAICKQDGVRFTP
jgi:phytoene dehydrogenase-like protein